VKLVSDRALAQRIGSAAHQCVRDHFLAPQHLGRYFQLIERLITAPASRTALSA
jgi:hypothetical protein